MKNKSNEHLSETNDVATRCKLYSVLKGYYDDPFLPLMAGMVSEKSSPEISRGYSLRVIFIRNFIKNFIFGQNETIQIISIGAGFDTLFWNLLQIKPNEKFDQNKDELKNFILFEIDFESVISEKFHRIKRRKELNIDFAYVSDTFQSASYKLIPCDVRDLNRLEYLLEKCGLDSEKPTLIFAECVLVYLEDEEVANILSFFSKKFKKSIFLNYDPMNFSDKFGEVMKRNLHDVEYDFRALESCSSLESHCQKYSRAGFENFLGFSMWEIYTTRLPSRVKKRIDSIEPLDEMELLKDLLDHYCISIGLNYYTSSDVKNFINFIDF